mmetsp:Transcript_101957/g.202426  ORF Transcript_101957/g.202426 Transcript_101957/m.202426 type:complete len:217 (+) Transcript_101957:103-753(+)
MAPSNQLDSPSLIALPTIRTVSNMMPVFTGWNFKLMGTSIAQPTNTVKGTTKRAICAEDPSATPRDKSILSFMATVTAVACSAALPTIGRRITPIKDREIPHLSIMPSILSTSPSEQYATSNVTMTSRKIAHLGPMVTSSSSACSDTNASGCVPNWKYRYMMYIIPKIIAAPLEIHRSVSGPWCLVVIDANDGMTKARTDKSNSAACKRAPLALYV